MPMGRPITITERDSLAMVVVPEKPPLIPLHSVKVADSDAIVEYKSGAPKADEEDLEVKLRRILDNVPVRVSNTSGSSAGSGSGDFHQYRQMRRKEQDRLARMDLDYRIKKRAAEFSIRREEKLKAAEERTSKKRLKRQKKKQKKMLKKIKLNGNEEELNKEQASEESEEEKG